MKQTNIKPTGKLAAIGIISALMAITLTSPSFGKGASGVINPPATKKDFKLGPKDKSITVTNKWWCLNREEHVDSPDLSSDSDVVADMMSNMNEKTTDAETKKVLGNTIKYQSSMYLADRNESAVKFWSAEQPEITLKAEEKKAWEDCYTKAELETAKTEALRWAKWVRENIK